MEFKHKLLERAHTDGYYTISPAIASGSQAYHIQHCWIFDAMVIQVLNKRDINLEGYNYIDDAEFYILGD